MIGTSDRFRQVHVGALALAAIMLPWSEFLLSIAQFLLLGNWLVEGVVRKDFAGRFRRAFTSGPALLFMSFFALHLVGLLWTTDLSWGLDLCRILLPVIAFTPVLASTKPLDAGELRTVLLLGAWSVVASTHFCMAMRYEVIGRGGYRELSIFISHIRLALLLCFSVVVFVVYRPRTVWPGVAHLLAIGWSLFFLDRLSSLLGAGIIALLACYGLWRASQSAATAMRWTLRGALILVPLAIGGYVAWCVHAYFREEPAQLVQLDERSAGGEAYYHDRVAPLRENGHYVWVNVADGELRRAWERRSDRPYTGTDAQGQQLRHTLVRYLASLGVRKDSIGMQALTEADVERVERGIPSVMAGRRDPVRARIDQVLYELEHYRMKGNASGHSVIMRYEFLRAGWAIARENILFGVGTGDTRPAFAAHYTVSNSVLEERWRLRAHNQYLTLLITFGLPGLLWCLFAWVRPAWLHRASAVPLFIPWAIIFLVSCLSEDTLETQMGATFFAYYYALFVFGARRDGQATT